MVWDVLVIVLNIPEIFVRTKTYDKDFLGRDVLNAIGASLGAYLARSGSFFVLVHLLNTLRSVDGQGLHAQDV